MTRNGWLRTVTLAGGAAILAGSLPAQAAGGADAEFAKTVGAISAAAVRDAGTGWHSGRAISPAISPN